MLAVTVTWHEPVYEARLESLPEWPPHPARLFCALVAAAEEGSADDDALRWLERQDPPALLAPDASTSVLEAFVPTNATGATRSNRVARTSLPRTWGRTHLAADHVHFIWERATPEPGVLARLRGLARRVPFVGRSTSQAVVTVHDRAPADDDLDRLMAQPAGTDRLRVPYDGYLHALRAAYDDGEPARTVSRWAFYGPPAPAPEPPAQLDRAYPTLATLPFAPGVALDGRQVVRVVTAFRRAVLRRLGRHFHADALALVHGHHDGTRRQCAFLGLPFVGHQHASGQLLGAGIALSPDLTPDVRRALLEVAWFNLDQPGLDEFDVPGLARAVALTASGDADAAGSWRWTTRPERWEGPSRTWVTAYPVVLDRYPDRIGQAPEYVEQGCVLAGYPEPEQVSHLAVSAVAGAPWLRGSDLRRRRSDPPRPAVHARIRFPVEVTGPVVVGHLRHVGLGLCVPEQERAGTER